MLMLSLGEESHDALAATPPSISPFVELGKPTSTSFWTCARIAFEVILPQQQHQTLIPYYRTGRHPGLGLSPSDFQRILNTCFGDGN